jgi:hypothetical protein
METNNDSEVLYKTFHNKATIVIIVLFAIVIIACLVLSLKIYIGTNKVKGYFTNDVASSTWYEVANQKPVNEKLAKIEDDSEYTLTNAYVEQNPYGISPLSGIIIFQTNDAEEVSVYINNVFVTKMEASTKHSIPIYGLYESFDNVIRLETKTESKEYVMTTAASGLEYGLDVVKSTQTTGDLYFTIASYSTHLTAWDTEGRLRFYITENNSMDVEWLNNGHFLIGVTQGQNGEQYIGFVEMDYLGKIYNYYTMKNGYSFEFQLLSDGNIMAAGGDVPVYFNHQVIYTMNPNDGSIVSDMDIYDIVKSIDPTFSDKYLGPSTIRNGFYYDESTGDIVVSFRNMNTIWSFNYKTKTLNWVLTDPNNELFKADVWKNYLITTDTGRYPLAQHSPQLVNGNLLYFNNGYDRYSVYEKGASDEVSNFKSAYSDVELLHVDPTTKTATTLWTYGADKNWFSIKYGYSRILANGDTLMNFGYILKDSYRSVGTNSLKDSEKNPDNIYTEIVEVDKDNNVVFEATSEEGKYRTFKHSIYTSTTSNVNVSTLNEYNTISNDTLTTTTYKKLDLDNASDWINTVVFTKNTFTTNYSIQSSDSVKLYLMNKAGKVYILDYKDADSSNINRIFNIDLPVGSYTLFIDVNGTIYKTGKVYTWE